MEVPDVPLNFVPAKAGEIITVGPIKLRVMEDGSNTDMRLSCVEITIPPRTRGPLPHWHEMHDETFLVLKGTARFHIPGKDHIDATVGDYVVVPTRSPHTFSNPTDEEAVIYNSFTPAFYINYFKLLGGFVRDGEFTPEANARAMSYFATIPVPEP
ncbi:hypothetical protein N7540_009073 [Penicillium herquei]|uniref:uncharacterized protein n=1 Tax=Penicillium malachiteum TaxID=1324776 RepID=UPI0025471E1B|nr:uncharacterized protein N7483_004347 [Penicillium malachiteum]KAJ5729839.1 hypothetical protein N7483_004347 [Penicillium malachiteum]KAJ6014482.1 hypothetical protein N7540_009073 [Penicillium herquei]